jgi:hypothetical protein
VAWISTRPQSLKEGALPQQVSNSTPLAEAKQSPDEIAAVRQSSIPTKSTIKKSLLPLSKIILWILYVITAFFAFCAISTPFLFTAIYPRSQLSAETPIILELLLLYLAIALFFLAIARYFRRRIYPN